MRAAVRHWFCSKTLCLKTAEIRAELAFQKYSSVFSFYLQERYNGSRTSRFM